MSRMKHKAFVVAITIGALVLSGVGTALAIVYGVPDGDAHPYVGSMVIHVPDEARDEDHEDKGEPDLYAQWCSGTLLNGIEGDVFLTAAHCVAGLEDVIPSVFDVAPEDVNILVTFDPVIDGENSTYLDPVNITWHPQFGTHGLADLFDVAIMEFGMDVTVGADEDGNRYGVLPEMGLLDDMSKASTLKDQQFEAVGYGAVRETRRGGFEGILDNSERRLAVQGFLSLTKAWITMSMNEATGNQGTCYGDSGGPHFLLGTNELVSVTVTGDAVCKATDKTYRLDTESAISFLEDFVEY
jgi:hypothetical protein